MILKKKRVQCKMIISFFYLKKKKKLLAKEKDYSTDLSFRLSFCFAEPSNAACRSLSWIPHRSLAGASQVWPLQQTNRPRCPQASFLYQRLLQKILDISFFFFWVAVILSSFRGRTSVFLWSCVALVKLAGAGFCWA